MNISFYLEDFLKKYESKQVIGIITQEFLSEDYERLFNNPITQKEKKGYKINGEIPSKYLSEKGRQNLRKYLENDYKCIDKL